MKNFKLNYSIIRLNECLEIVKSEHSSFKNFNPINLSSIYDYIEKINNTSINKLPIITNKLNHSLVNNILVVAFSGGHVTNLDNFLELVKLKSSILNLKSLTMLFFELFDDSNFVSIYKNFPKNLIENFEFKKFMKFDPVVEFSEFLKNDTDDLNFKKSFMKFHVDESTRFYRKTYIKAMTTLSKLHFEKLNNDLYHDFIDISSAKEKGSFFNNYLYIVDSIESRYATPLIKKMGDGPLLNEGKNKNQFWNELSKANFDRIKTWYLSKKIEHVFGNDERSDYWKKYVKHFNLFCYKEEYGQVFMFIKNYVIIEFLSIGNATYIYSKKDFEENFKEKMNSKISYKNNVYKNKSIAYERLSHVSNWQYSFDFAMQKIIKG